MFLRKNKHLDIKSPKSGKKIYIKIVSLLTFVIVFIVIPCKLNASKSDEIVFNRAKAIIMGQYLKKKYPGEKVLVIHENKYKSQYSHIAKYKKFIATLEQVFGKKNVKAHLLQLKILKDYLNEDGKTTFMPIDEIMTPKDFDAVVSKHPGCNIIISLIGLPRRNKKMKVWNNPQKHIALLMSNVYAQKKLFEEGKIVAGVEFRAKPNFKTPPVVSNPQATFNIRYLLITPENIKNTLKKNPKIMSLDD